MNSKGEFSVGTVIILAVTLIVGILFVQITAQQVGDSTNTVTANSSQTLAVLASSIYIDDYRALSGVTIVNASNQSQTVPSTNYTVTNNAINPTTGSLSVQITTDDGTWNSSAVYVQGTAQPVTYIAESGGRAVAGLIVIMFALAVAAVALMPSIGSEVMRMFGR